MNNFEYIKTLNLEEAGHFICAMMGELLPEEDDRLECEVCPVRPICHTGSNGWINWLKEEHKDEG